jgi:hypothetical protein
MEIGLLLRQPILQLLLQSTIVVLVKDQELTALLQLGMVLGLKLITIVIDEL